MSGGCGTTSGVGSGTFTIVESQIDVFKNYASDAFSASMEAMSTIADGFSGVANSIQGLSKIDLPYHESVEFVRPTRPELNEDIAFTVPAGLREQPSTGWKAGNNFSIDAGSVPEFTAANPVLGIYAFPSTALPTRPNDPDALVVPTYPDSPELPDTELPDLLEITLPELVVPDLSVILAQVAALRSSIPTAPSLPSDINYLALVRQFMNEAKPDIDDILVNLVPSLEYLLSGESTGIPANVADLLRNRAFSAEDKQAFQAESEVLNDWLSRGFTLPGGALESRLLAVRQENRDKKWALNRDLWIEEAKQEIENLRTAIQQGIAYEGMHKDALTKLYGIAGQLAEQQANVTLKIIDAAIEIYKAKAQMWQIQFSVIKDEIQIELSKLEAYKTELEGQRLVSQLNQQTVDVYKAQLEAVNQRVAIYKTQVDATNSELQAELGKLEYAKSRVQIYTAEISAYETTWKAYGEAVRSDLGKVELHKSLTQAYAARVDAYGKNVDAEKAKASLEIEKLTLEVKEWETQIELFKAQLQAEVSRVESLTKIYESSVRVYATDAQIEETYVTSELKKLDYDLSVEKFTADVAIKAAELEQTKLVETSKIAVGALDGVARTGAQLAGSAMSAMNVGASISSSSGFSQSVGCSESYNYDMSE